MTPQQIERWAGLVIEQVCAGKFQEDVRVELKRDWPEDNHGMARRLAAHANAARADSILWVIGVDEKAREVVGVSPRDPASWWPSVCKSFDGEAPAIVPVTMRVEGENVVALYFETTAAPYVVSNRAHGSAGEKVQWEVPWRAAANTRSATRSELVSILVPRAQAPALELMRGQLTTERREAGGVLVSLELDLYVVSRTAEPLILPRHRISGELLNPDVPAISLNEFALPQPLKPVPKGGPGHTHYGKTQPLSPLVRVTDTEVIVDYAGVVWLRANAVVGPMLVESEHDATVSISLRPAQAEVPTVLAYNFHRPRMGDTIWVATDGVNSGTATS